MVAGINFKHSPSNVNQASSPAPHSARGRARALSCVASTLGATTNRPRLQRPRPPTAWEALRPGPTRPPAPHSRDGPSSMGPHRTPSINPGAKRPFRPHPPQPSLRPLRPHTATSSTSLPRRQVGDDVTAKRLPNPPQNPAKKPCESRGDRPRNPLGPE
ncbi:hypothetical protein PVAP13_9KG644966, partial [Panicum virgatum]